MDETQDAAAKLRALADSSEKAAPKIDRLRDLLPDIEKARAAGVPQIKILEVLNDAGLDLKMGAYSAMLWRARHGKSRNKPSKEPPATPALAVAEIPEQEIGQGREAEPLKEIMNSEIVESRKNREAKAQQYIGADANPLIKKLNKGNK